MMHATRTIAILLFAAIPVVSNAQEESPQLVVIDLRPTEEKDGTGLKELDGKCNENVFRIADVATDPLKLDILREDLSRIQMIKPKTLTVLNWSIYYNKQVNKDSSFLKGVGVGGYTVPTGKSDAKQPGSKCSQKESAGGWYEGKEVTGIYFPLISEFAGTFGGKPVNVRLVYSPSRKLEGKFEGGERDTEALLEVVHQTAEQLIVATSR